MPSGIGRDAAVEPPGAGGGLAAEIRVGSAPGRAGPGEPDAESRASNTPAEGRDLRRKGLSPHFRGDRSRRQRTRG